MEYNNKAGLNNNKLNNIKKKTSSSKKKDNNSFKKVLFSKLTPFRPAYINKKKI